MRGVEGRMRHLVLVALLWLSACGGEPEAPACCAIEPEAKCVSHLLGAGVTRDEVEALRRAAGRPCPGPAMDAARIRGIANLRTPDCNGLLGGMLQALETGACAAAPSPASEIGASDPAR